MFGLQQQRHSKAFVPIGSKSLRMNGAHNAIDERIFREDGHQSIREGDRLEPRLIAGVWSKDVLIRSRHMKRMMLMIAAVLIASAAVGYAQQKGGNAGGASKCPPRRPYPSSAPEGCS
jgi:hypothetical protein